MIYGFSMLFFLLGMVLLIPAARKLLFMRAINRNPATTAGTVISSKSSMGWMWTASFGNQDRPLVRYQSPRGSDLVLEVTAGSILPQRRYEPGSMVTVVYDRDMPGSAYLQNEQQAARRDLRGGILALIGSILLAVIGVVFNFPA
jgi:hypothetical protein